MQIMYGPGIPMEPRRDIPFTDEERKILGRLSNDHYEEVKTNIKQYIQQAGKEFPAPVQQKEKEFRT